MEISQKAQVNKIGAEDNGVVEWVEVEDQEEILEGVVDVVDTVVVEDEEAVVVVEEIPQILILWRVTVVGCMAIWPVTVPTRVHSRQVVAVLALPQVLHSNPGIQAQSEEEAVEDQFDSGFSLYYMMRMEMSTPWTVQVSCTSLTNLNKL